MMDDDTEFAWKIKRMLREAQIARERQRIRLAMDTVTANFDQLTHDDLVELYNSLVVRLAGYK